MRRLLCLTALLLALPVLAAPWDLGPKRVRVEFPAQAADTGVVLFPLALMPAEFWSTVNATDGRDVRVTADDADTQVPLHLIGFDQSNTWGWVRAADAVATGGGNAIVIYWGDGTATMPLADSTYGSENAYDANIAAAWTFVGGSLVDHTSNGFTLTNNNSTPTASGPFDGLGAFQFTAASSQYLSLASTVVSTWPISIAAWFKTPGTVNFGRIASLNKTSNFNNTIGLATTTTPQLYVEAQGDSGTNSTILAGSSISTGTWYLGVASRDAAVGTTSSTVVDNDTQTETTTIATADLNRFTVGARYRSGAGSYSSDTVGPVEVHNSVRSADYWTTYENMMANSATVFTVGAVENEPTGGVTDWLEFTTITSSTGWTNASNALTSLITAATDDIPDGTSSNALILTDLDGAASEVTGQTITGIEFEISATGEDAGARELYDDVLRVYDAGAVGTDFGIGTIWTDNSIVTRTYGGAGNMLGTSLTDTDITASTFGITMTFLSDGTDPALMSIYRVRVRIYYGTPPVGTDGSFFY